MMRTTLLLGLALGLLAGCQSPVTDSGDGTTLQPGQTKLVFQVGGSRALNLLDADFVTLQLTPVDGEEPRFASSPGGGTGTYSLVVEGLTSGDWSLKVRFYTSATSTTLLFYANLDHYVEAGRSNTIDLEVYPAGTIDGVTVFEAIPGFRIDVADLEEGPWSPHGTQGVGVGQALQLRAEVVGAAGTPASDQRVLWSSSDETILEVSSSGLVKGLRTGEATLTARTVVGSVTSSYSVVVDVDVVGLWEADAEGYDGVLRRVALFEVSRTPTGGLEATLWTGLDQEGLARVHYEETGPLHPAGRSTFLFLRPRSFFNDHGSTWVAQPPVQGESPAVLKVTAPGELSLMGTDRGSNSTEEWKFRRSSLRLDDYDAPLPLGTLKPAAVGQTRYLMVFRDGFHIASTPEVPGLVWNADGGLQEGLLWSSSDPAVATVETSRGRVTFVGPGKVSIRAQATSSPDRVFKLDFNVQSSVDVSTLFGVLPSDEGTLLHVAADTLSGGGWLVSGQGSTTAATQTAVLTRFLSNGDLDSAFGGNSGWTDLEGLPQSGVIQVRNGARWSPGFVQTEGLLHFATAYTDASASPQYRFGPSGTLMASYSDMAGNNQVLEGFHAQGAPVVDSQGNLFLLGQRQSDNRTVVKMLPPGGEVASADASAHDFWVSPETATAFVGAQIAVLPDDSLLVVANDAGNASGRLVRLVAGTLDTGFGSGGTFAFDNGNGDGNRHYSAVQVAKDKIYLTGWDWLYTSHPRWPFQYTGFILRLTLDGTIDTGFAPGGNLGYQASATHPLFALNHPFEHPYDLDVGPDGRIVVVGQSSDGRGFAVRLEPDARAVDRTFGGTRQLGDGVLLDQGQGSKAHSVAIDAQNRVAIVGRIANSPAFWRF